MITEIQITNFRGIANGTVSGLKLLTALVGASNSGKSTILEALYLDGCRGHLAALAKVARVRGWVGPETVRAITYRNRRQCVIMANQRWKLELDVGQDGKSISVHFWEDIYQPKKTLLSFDDSGGTPSDKENRLALDAVFIDIGTIHEVEGFEKLYSDAIETGTAVEEHLTALCAMLRAATKQLRILVKDNRPLLYTIDLHGSCALHFAGDGMRRLFKVACFLAVAKGRLVLIEEPECFQHPRALEELVKLIWVAIAQGTQIVFSTHSLELLAKVFEKQKGRDLDKACLIRTRLTDGKLITGVIDGPEASERLEDVGEDLRQ
ncbi:MAG: AAA family ATPase [Planctomycetota bacterium]